jgi:hypothetical protein
MAITLPLALAIIVIVIAVTVVLKTVHFIIMVAVALVILDVLGVIHISAHDLTVVWNTGSHALTTVKHAITKASGGGHTSY